MKVQKVFGIASALLLLAATVHGQAYTPAFSVVNGGLPGDDILNPGSIPVFFGTGLYEVDAISGNQHFGEEWVFSVDITSVGAPGTAVNQEATAPLPNDQPADIYSSAGFGFNALDWDGDGIPNPLLGSMGFLGLLEPAGDDVDGLEVHGFPANTLTQPLGSIYYSLSQASANGIGFDGATLFMSPAVNGYDVAPFVPYATSAQLGLLGGGLDDIDAAVVYDLDQDGMWSPGDFVDFSLAPGSASGGAADVFRTTFGGGPGLFVAAGALGLLPSDNLDALDVIPEPSSVILLVIGGGVLLRSRKYFRS